VAESVTEVPDGTAPVWLEAVAVVVGVGATRIWKHSLVVVVDNEAVKDIVLGAYTAAQQYQPTAVGASANEVAEPDTRVTGDPSAIHVDEVHAVAELAEKHR
jgi:hypothetical protein